MSRAQLHAVPFSDIPSGERTLSCSHFDYLTARCEFLVEKQAFSCPMTNLSRTDEDLS
jgi:hypothetical protein